MQDKDLPILHTHDCWIPVLQRAKASETMILTQLNHIDLLPEVKGKPIESTIKWPQMAFSIAFLEINCLDIYQNFMKVPMVQFTQWAIISPDNGLVPNRQFWFKSLQWRPNGRDSISNHQPHDCLLNRLFRRRSKKTLKLRVTGLCVGNSPGTGEFPAQMASNVENVSIWWCHHVSLKTSPESWVDKHRLW